MASEHKILVEVSPASDGKLIVARLDQESLDGWRMLSGFATGINRCCIILERPLKDGSEQKEARPGTQQVRGSPRQQRTPEPQPA